MRVLFVLLALMLAGLSVQAEGAATTHTLFLTTDTADFPERGLTGVEVLASAMTGDQGRVTFAGATPPVGDERVVSEATWFWGVPAPMDMQIQADTRISLYLTAQAQATAQLRIELDAVLEDGSLRSLAQASRFVTAQGATTQATLSLPTADKVVPEGALVSLSVRLDGLALATVMEYDHSGAPSQIESLRWAPLDSDGDGMPDSLERRGGFDPFDPKDPGDHGYDSDGDGIPDTVERDIGTDPSKADSDGDGWGDGMEVRAGTDPLSRASIPLDDDGDGIPNGLEERTRTRADMADSDGDGTSDCDEDPDMDNLTHCEEVARGTDPHNADTDGDGVLDGDEVAAGTDPLRHPDPPEPRIPAAAELAVALIFLVAGFALALTGLAWRHRA